MVAPALTIRQLPFFFMCQNLLHGKSVFRWDSYHDSSEVIQLPPITKYRNGRNLGIFNTVKKEQGKGKGTTSAGFEPARAEPKRFLILRLNHSAKMP